MEEQYKKAKDYVFKLLTFRPRSAKEIKDKLSEKKYSFEVIRQVMEMLEEYNYIDDKNFAGLWIQNRCSTKPMGQWRLKQELALKGIAQEIIVEQLSIHLPYEKEYELALGLIEKKKKPERDKRQKMYNFLQRRGFSRDIVKRVIGESAWQEAENPHE